MPDIRASIPASNYTRGRGVAIDTIVFHHIVGDAGAAIARFRQPGVEVSSTYIIGSDGQVYYTVDEANTPYTNGNYSWNQRSITIEQAGGGGGVPYTEAMYRASENLVRSIMARHRITIIKRHRDIVPTACPGGLDVERILRGAKGDTSMKIGSEPNWRWRMNLLHHQLVGNWDMSDAVFKSIIGQDAWSVVENWSSHPNAPETLKFQEVGQVAVRDKWDQQIYALQAQVAELGKRPTQAQLDELNKTAEELKLAADEATIKAAEAEAQAKEANDKAKGLEDQANKDKATSDSFLRQLGQFLTKYLPFTK